MCVRCSVSLSVSLLSPEIRSDVVADDQARREEKPKNPIKYVVGNELELRHDHANCNDCPGQLTNLQGQVPKTQKTHGNESPTRNDMKRDSREASER